MNKKVRVILSMLLAVTFIGSTAMIIVQRIDYAKAKHSYEDAEKISGRENEKLPVTPLPEISKETEEEESEDVIVEESLTEPEIMWIPEPITEDSTAELLKETDFNSLRNVNEDVVGWIMIPGTLIDYPILYGEDNQYYLNHTWDNKKNFAGSIFLEHANSSEFHDFHTVIYGHNMKDKSMFGGLRSYSKQAYWEKHPYVYLATDEGVWRYEIYAAFEAEVDGPTYYIGFEREEDKQDYLNHGMEESVIETSVIPEVTDRILTLSTCTSVGYETRWVVQARLKMIPEE